MSKIDNMDQLDEQKEALFSLIDDFRESLDLDFEDLDLESIKDWGRSLLIAGAGAFVLYKVMSGIFGSKNVKLKEDNAILKGIKVKDDSALSRFVKEQMVVLLLTLVRRWIKKYLRAKSIIDED